MGRGSEELRLDRQAAADAPHGGPQLLVRGARAAGGGQCCVDLGEGAVDPHPGQRSQTGPGELAVERMPDVQDEPAALLLRHEDAETFEALQGLEPGDPFDERLFQAPTDGEQLQGGSLRTLEGGETGQDDLLQQRSGDHAALEPVDTAMALHGPGGQ